MDSKQAQSTILFSSLSEMFEAQAATHSTRTAFVFEDDNQSSESWTYTELLGRSRTLGNWLSRQVSVGDRVLLVYPPGLEFIAAFMGCIYAGVLPVPATYPKPRRPMPRLDSIVADCQPVLVLTQSSTISGISLDQQSPAISAMPWQSTDEIVTDNNCGFRPVVRSRDDLAFLQYTSGSTSEPRGVMVSHGNLLHNLEAIRIGFGINTDEHSRGVFWLPAYHDMGLIGGILTPLYVGGTSTLIAPTTFLRRPQRWLELISSTRATISGAPNFGYELASRKITAEELALLDLSRWRLAFCGAEPISPETLEEFAKTFEPAGFKRSAFFPCYGLAESTLLVTGGQTASGPKVIQIDRQALRENYVVTLAEQNGHTQPLVGCGQECRGMDVRIVDPLNHSICPADQIGEIWIRGDSISRGYWNKRDVNAEIFMAKLVDDQASKADGFLRTGDLGFCFEDELFVTGRLKDVIIVRGRNHYPHDLERTAQAAHPAVDAGAAFSVDVNGHEELVLVHQWKRENRLADQNEMIQAIRTAIVEEHEIDPHAIAMIRPASLPMTSSGKIQRNRCRELYLAGELPITAGWIRESVQDQDVDAERDLTLPPDFLSHLSEMSDSELRTRLQEWLINWLTMRANIRPGTMQPDTPFAKLGIDSLTAVEISQELDKLLGLQSPPMVIWSCPTPAELVEYLAGELQTVKT